jgi:hypothetical protein
MNEALFFRVYRVPKKSLEIEKFEYLRHIATIWADIFTTDKVMFIAHFHKRNVVKNLSEVFSIDFNKGL